jgi:type I restriction enzyme S subunit
MRSNYKRLGDYIQEVNIRNKELIEAPLMGVSIKKVLMPSIANIIGTDMSTYKLIQKNQFAYGPVTSRNGDKISIALLEEHDKAMVSQAYTVFEVMDVKELAPEYLMMWFRRPEFDRYARFMSHGSAREIFSWTEMRDTLLPIPSPEKQLEIVKEYNTVQKRISLNNQLITKLEETAQAIYKQWFVDFEFPDTNGKPYKSNGGEMVFCEEFEKEIPKGWEYNKIQKLIDDKIILNNQDGNHGEIHPKSSDFVSGGIPFIMANNVNYGTVDIISCSFITKEHSSRLRIGFSKSGDVLLTHKATMGRVAIVPEIEDYIMLTPQVTYYRIKDSSRMTKEFLYYLFNSYNFQETLIGESEQSTRNYMGITSQRLIKIIIPNPQIILAFSEIVKPIIKYKGFLILEIYELIKMEELLLARMTKVESGINTNYSRA